jgi:HPt (histidine-containing phosphotransfer) domain-containing protein
MDERDKLQQQMAEIGNRYLRRTLSEMPRLQELAAQLRNAPAGDLTSIEELEQMAHKIHGSGAMFGFDAVSESAGKVELLAASRVVDAQSLQQLATLVNALEQDVRAAARSRGVE